MHLSIHNRSWLRGMVAGAVALASASACSRSDRATAGRDTTQTGALTPADTQTTSSTAPSASAQPTPSTPGSTTSADTTKATHHKGVAGYQAMGTDSSTASGTVGDSTQASATSAPASDTTATTMAAAPSDTTLATADTSASREVSSDTSNAGAAPMARDTSVALAQGDSAGQVGTDTASVAQEDTATIGDTAVILARPDTSKTEMATADTAGAERMHADTVSQKAAELAKHEPVRVRPPADSTELQGNVTTDNAGANADARAVGAAGVESTGNIATGAEALATMTRQGQQCSVATTEEHPDVLWDLASSPATLNPCGTGTMTLPRIWTGEKK